MSAVPSRLINPKAARAVGRADVRFRSRLTMNRGRLGKDTVEIFVIFIF